MEKVTFASMARKLVELPMIVHEEVHLELKWCAMEVRDEAVKKLGYYQPAAGDLPAWAPLAESTIKAKERAGGGEDPLIGHYSKPHEYVSGNNLFKSEGSKNTMWPQPLRNSIGTHVDGWMAQVGSDDPLAAIHEYGVPSTEDGGTGRLAGKNHNITIPERSFLRSSLFEKVKRIGERMADALQRSIRKI